MPTIKVISRDEIEFVTTIEKVERVNRVSIVTELQQIGALLKEINDRKALLESQLVTLDSKEVQDEAKAKEVPVEKI